MENNNEYGDFKEIKEEEKILKKPLKKSKKKHKGKSKYPISPLAPTRVRQPREGQFLGVVLERLGGKRMSVKSTDGKIRNCRVPGRFSRKFWLRPGNAVIVEPWPDNDEKADVIYQYRPAEFHQLKKRGILDNLKEEF